MSVRVYVAASLASLAGFLEDGGIGPSPVRAHAVTDWLRAEWPEGGEDEWEYAALMAAADDSARSLGPEDPPRRVVLAADVDQVTPEGDSTVVAVDSAIALRLVQAVHADLDDVDPTSPEDLDDLRWFGVQEIPDLLG